MGMKGPHPRARLFASVTIAAGQRLAHYEVLGPLGAGGMGEVYRARDTRLEREVAIKVLPEELADDEDRLRRFEREAKTLATLNHPNVAGIHGVDQVDGVCFLALELVPGKDLATRLSKGALPVEDAIDVCRQIAEGLEAAHEAGVVHRDLKPANVRVTPEGAVKILDFGLAKPVRPKATSEGTSTAESDSFLMTEEGLVLGTPTYMSPEQARGKPVDRRTDVWAFGCVLYECLTGKRAFGGESLSDVLAEIIGGEPDWTRVPDVPARVRALLERTLTKDPRARLRDMGEARIALEAAFHEPVESEGARSTAATRRGAYVSSAVAGLAAFALGLFVGRGARDPGDATSSGAGGSNVHVQIHEFAPGRTPRGFAISPDGRAFAWADAEGLWVRQLDELDPVLVHAGNAVLPRWFANGQELWFVEDGELHRIPASGGVADPVGHVGDLFSYWDWLPDDRFLFGDGERSWSARRDGEAVEVLQEFDLGARMGHWHLLYLLGDGGILGAFHEFNAVFDKIQVFRDGEVETVVQLPEGELGDMVITKDGVLAYGVNNEGESSLWSVPISLDDGRRLGEPRLYARGAGTPSISHDGSLAYVLSEGSDRVGQPAWLDASDPGSELVLFDEPRISLSEARISPDGRHVLLQEKRSMTVSTFLVHDLDRGVSTPLVQREGMMAQPVWLSDDRLSIGVPREGTLVYSLTGRGSGDKLDDDILVAVSPDGRYFVIGILDEGNWATETQIVGPGLDGDVLPNVDPGDVFRAFSADSRWMLYGSERSGTHQLYLSAFPPGEEDHSVCVAETAKAWFRADGKAIYYVMGEQRLGPQTLWRVALTLEPEVKLGVPEVVRVLARYVTVQDYDGHDRFLVVAESEETRKRAFLHTGWTSDSVRR